MNTETKVREEPQPTSSGSAVMADRLAEILTLILLSLVAVLTAWCGFQASKWGGEMSIAFSNASSNRVQANNAEGTARDARLYDMSLFTQWVLADADDNDVLRSYVEERFTPEFAVAFDQWEAEGREQRGPLMMDSYIPPGTQEAEDLSNKSAQYYQSALDFNQQGDDYSLLTVIFALVLFLAAISQRIVVLWARLSLLAVALSVAVGASIVMSTFPIKI